MSQAILEYERIIAPPSAGAGEIIRRLGRLPALFPVLAPPAALAASAVLAWGKGAGVMELSLLASFYALAAIGLEMGYHRLLAHRSFQTTSALRTLLAILGAMAGQGPVTTWVAMHRRRHQLDHRQIKKASPGNAAEVTRWASDLVRDRQMGWVDRHYRIWLTLGLVLPAIAGGVLSSTWSGVLSGFVWGGLVRLLLTHYATWSIDSFGHNWGERRFRSLEESRNSLPLALLTFGGGWRNNHDAFPTSAAHGLEWWQIDISHWLIRSFEMLGLAWNVKRPTV
jgi:stearoyl-CoA desaturase (delta-9 desaturase)